MKEPAIYVDLDGNELALDGLEAEEQQLVKRVRRRARENPKWHHFERYCRRALARFVAHRPARAPHVPRTVAFRVMDDLIARLQRDQGITTPSSFREELETLFYNRHGSQDALAREIGMPKKVVRELLAGRQLPFRDMVEILVRLTICNAFRRVLGELPGGGRKRGRAAGGRKRRPRCSGYELHFVGGPADGHIEDVSAPAPPVEVTTTDQAIYRAKLKAGRAVREHRDQGKEAIRLYFAGYAREGTPYPE